ncbi:MAG TPA: GxxExxY protein [Vicinamibacterales bacterium]|nr:GxxExxY protein [Vicinamibacterales bacterium]
MWQEFHSVEHCGRLSGLILQGALLAHEISMLIDAAFNDLTGKIIGAAIEVHRHLGPGLLESSYLDCLHQELAAQQLRFDRQRTVPLVYKGVPLTSAYRIDLVVEDLIVVEAKSVERLLSVHEAQVLTYLRIANRPAGLLINFNVAKLLDGLKRIINPRYTGPNGVPPVPEA